MKHNLKLFALLIITNMIFSLRIKSDEQAQSILKKLINYNDIIQKITDPSFSSSFLNTQSSVQEDVKNSSNLDYMISNSNQIESDILPISTKLKEINNSNIDFNTKLLNMVNTLINYVSQISKEILLKNEENILKYSKDYDLDDTSFLEISLNQADSDPPKPYSGTDIPCNSSGDCTGKKLKWMK